MIKARAGGLVVLGLSRKNCEKLLEGKPISIDGGAELGIPGLRILIMAGEDEETLAAQLEPFIDANTKVADRGSS